ncbi:MAG: hypothetical protein OEZ36_09780, partial [Spirochaetota bacterium]|nr:hypothetical protein [Spirochaetota bacterium]
KQRHKLKSIWKKEIVVGGDAGCDIILEDLETSGYFVIQAYYDGRRKHRLLDEHDLAHFTRKQRKDRLSYGDKFSFSNYQITFII